jgi:hypothetical protein
LGTTNLAALADLEREWLTPQQIHFGQASFMETSTSGAKPKQHHESSLCRIIMFFGCGRIIAVIQDFLKRQGNCVMVATNAGQALQMATEKLDAFSAGLRWQGCPGFCNGEASDETSNLEVEPLRGGASP